VGVDLVAARIRASYYWSQQLFHFLMQPVFAALRRGRRRCTSRPRWSLHHLSEVGLYAGLFVASPMIFWQNLMFVAPGLYGASGAKIVPFVVAATLFSWAARCSATGHSPAGFQLPDSRAPVRTFTRC